MSNPMYTNKAQMFLRSDIALFITDDPYVFSLEWPGVVDKIKGKQTTETAGPFDGTVAEFRVSRSYPTFDEKGTVGRHPFILLALDIPDGTFALDRTVIIGTRRFRISDILVTPEGINEVGLELEVPGGG